RSAISSSHQHSPLLQARRAVDVVGALDVRERRAGLLGVPVAGEHGRIALKSGQLVKAAVHVVDVAAGEVGAAAALEEQRVAGDQTYVEKEALAAGGVAGRVQQFDFDVADVDLVAVFVRGEVAFRDAGDA